MADVLQFDLVSPERRLASVEAATVQIPGADGDMTAMPDHAPLITTLRPGILTVSGPSGTEEFVVSGGFAQINSENATVLAVRAYKREDVTREILDELLSIATEARDNARPATLDAATKTVADLTAMGEQLGV